MTRPRLPVRTPGLQSFSAAIRTGSIAGLVLASCAAWAGPASAATLIARYCNNNGNFPPGPYVAGEYFVACSANRIWAARQMNNGPNLLYQGIPLVRRVLVHGVLQHYVVQYTCANIPNFRVLTINQPNLNRVARRLAAHC